MPVLDAGWFLPDLHVRLYLSGVESRLVHIWPLIPGWLIPVDVVDEGWSLLDVDTKLVPAEKRVPNFGLPGVDARLVLVSAPLAPTDNAHQESFVDLLAPAHKIWKENIAASKGFLFSHSKKTILR